MKRPRCSERTGTVHQCERLADYRVILVDESKDRYVPDESTQAPYCSDHAAARKRFGRQYRVVSLFP